MNEFELRMMLLPLAAQIVATRQGDFPVSDLVLSVNQPEGTKGQQIGHHVKDVLEGIISAMFKFTPHPVEGQSERLDN